MQGPWQLIIAGFLFITFYWKAGVFTVSEYLERRYNPGCRLFYAIIYIFFFIVTISSGLYLTALFMESAFGWDFWICVFVLALVVGVYTCFGGLSAVIMTDAIQFLIMMLATLPVYFILTKDLGGFTQAANQMIETMGTSNAYFNLMPGADHPFMGGPWLIVGQCFVAALAWAAGQQAMIQRNLGARTVYDAKFGNVMAAIPKTLGAYIYIIPLTIAPLYFALNGIFLPKPDAAYGTLILNLLPSGMIGLAFAGLFAAGMSTMDSMLNSTSTLFVRDIYERFFVRDKPDAHYFRVARLVTLAGLLICVGSVAFIMKVPLIMTMEKTLMAMFEGPLVAVIVLGIFWRRTNGKGALAGLIIGGIVTLLTLSYTDKFLVIETMGAAASLAVVILVSMLTEAPRSDQVEGLTWGVGHESKIGEKISERAVQAQPLPPVSRKVPIYRDMRVWATIFLLIQIVLLLYYAGV